MATIFSAKLDGSEAVRYFHVPIVGFYLGTARDYARSSLELDNGDVRLRKVICAVTFSSMALEALINEAADDVIPSNEKVAFDKGQKPHKKAANQSLVKFKYVTLIEMYKGSLVPPEVLSGIDELIDIRNTLVHYKPMDTAGKHILNPPTSTPTADGKIMTSISFIEKPRRIEAPFIQRLSPEVAVNSYNTAVRAIRCWQTLCGSEWDEQMFPELSSKSLFNIASSSRPLP